MANREPSRWDVEAAVRQSTLPAQSRLIIYTLLTHVTNGTLTVPARYAPTFSGLVGETGLARGTLSKYLNQLEADGWLTRKRPSKDRAMRGHQRTGYEITPPVHLVNQFESRTSSPDEPLRGAVEQERHDSRTGSPSELVREPNGSKKPQVRTSATGEPVREPNRSSSGAEHSPTYGPTFPSPTEKEGGVGGTSRRPKVAAEHPRFAEFYDAYPVHKARGAAVRAFNKAVDKADPRTLIAAARLYRDDPQVRRGYGKHPATWLNAECWLDEPAQSPGWAATRTDGVPGHGPRARVNDQWVNGQRIEL